MSTRAGILGAFLLLVIGALVLLRDEEPTQLTPLEAGATAYLDIAYGDNGDRNLLDVYTPTGDGPHPTVIWLHPGGWTVGDKSWSMPVWDWTERGYAVVAVNYRFAYDAYTVADSVDDALDATRYIIDNHAVWNLDPDRIGVYGFSAGGHLAAMIAHADLPVAAIAVAGAPTDFIPLLDPSVPFFDGHTGPEVVDAVQALLGCDSETNCKTAAAALSPARLDPGSAPVLIVHGENDGIVDVDQGRRYADHLREMGAAVDFVVVPEGGHSPHVVEGGIDRFFDDALLNR